MSHLFQPDRSLLYPQFETYRLHPLDPSDDISSVHLPGAGATQARVGYNTHLLSFKETRARISWNHLTTFGNRGVYIDVDWNVVGFTIDNHFTPHFGIITTLPTPISSAESSQHPEYPSVLALSRTRWVIATGSGTVYILNTSPDDNFTGQFIARYDLVSNTNDTLPFVLQAAHVEGNVARILISRSVRNTLGKRKISSSATTFELAEITIDLERENPVDQGPEEVNVNWTLQGGDAPYSCQWGKDGWTVLSSEAFKSEEKEEEETEEDKIKRERQEKIGKLGLGASLSEDSEKETSMQVEEQNQEEEREWPYSWTQTSDSVSISIPLSNSTSRSDISVGLTSTSFSLSINTPVSPILATFVSKPERQFWTAIDPSASTWSFDSTKHQLDLELSKVDLNTRWPSVFSLDEEDEDEEEVPETLSQAILDAVKASFTNIQTRAEGEPAGNHPAIPALLREEMDYDLEDGEDFGENETGVFGEPGGGSKVGREVFIGHIKDGQPTWSKSPVSVVSLPLHGGGGQGGIMIKSAVDGLLFTPSLDPSKEVWNHLSTSPALSFVLSSKRDIRLVRHLPIEPPLQSHDVKKPKVEKATTVLAFDAGGSGMASGNVYIYYPPLSATTAKQGVVRVSGGDRGALLGVGEVTVGGKRVVIALCEKSLVVLHGVLRE